MTVFTRSLILKIVCLLLLPAYAITQPLSKKAVSKKKQPELKDDPSPIKLIKLKPDTVKYIPARFYIQDVTDSTRFNDSLGFCLQLKSGKKQKIQLAGGTREALKNFIDSKVNKDSTLYPLILSLTDISITEERNKPYDKTNFKYEYEFCYLHKTKNVKLGTYSGSGSVSTPTGMAKKYDSLFTIMFDRSFPAIDEQMKEAVEKSPYFCKGVKLNVSFRKENKASDNDTIFYDGYHDLNWEDFSGDSKGAENSYHPFIGIYYEPDVEYSEGFYRINIKVSAQFIKPDSWAGKNTRQMSLLYHIQTRFKIAWMQAMRLKQNFEKASFTCENYNAELRKIFNDLVKKTEAALDQHDKETKYGQNKKEEQHWRELTDTQLAEFEKQNSSL